MGKLEFRKIVDVSELTDQSKEQAAQVLGLIGSNASKSLAPVRYGFLRNSITYKTEKIGNGNGNIPLQTIVKKWAVIIGTRKDYAPHVEFGTRYMRAIPFLLPSIYYIKKSVKIIRDIFMKGLKR